MKTSKPISKSLQFKLIIEENKMFDQEKFSSSEISQSRSKINFLDICTKMFPMQSFLEVYQSMIRIWKYFKDMLSQFSNISAFL
jgi:flagellar biosynthesis protein FlhB